MFRNLKKEEELKQIKDLIIEISSKLIVIDSKLEEIEDKIKKQKICKNCSKEN